MSDPHLPFLRAVAADPTDDLPRLVYADFLEETGDPVHVARAHFIRAQIAIETLPHESTERAEMCSVEARLRSGFLKRWAADLPAALTQHGRVEWRRGFVHGIDVRYLPGNDLNEYGSSAWFNTLPIQRVGFEVRGVVDLAGWIQHFRWQHVTSLRLLHHFQPRPSGTAGGEAFIRELMTSSAFTSLRSLDFRMSRINDAWMVRFVSQFPYTSFAPSLQRLSFGHCTGLTDAGANALATARGLDQLTQLEVDYVPLSVSALDMLRRRFGSRLVFT